MKFEKEKIEKGKIKKEKIVKKDDEKIRKSLHYSNVEGTFASAANNITGNYITPFALALKATNAEIGFLHSMQSLAGTIAQIPGAKIHDWLGSRKRVWFFSHLIQRFFWIPIILLPFLSITNPVGVLILLLIFASFFAALRGPSWSSLMGDLVPKKIWGRYFGLRNTITGIAGLFSILIAGQLLIWFGFPILFTIALVLGFLSIFFFMKIYEPPFKREFHYKHSITLEPKNWVTAIKLNKNFFYFTLFMTLLSFAVSISSPFFAVYMLIDLNIGYLWYAVLIIIEMFIIIISQPYWGKLCDKIGDRKVIIISAVLVSFVPFYWLFIYSPWPIIIAHILSGFAWAGFGIATFNFMLAAAPAEKRPEYTANYSFFTGLAVVFGTLAGGILAEFLKDYNIFWIHGLQIVFLISFIARLSCLLLLPKLKETRIEERGYPLSYIFWRAITVNPIRGLIHAIHHPHYEWKKEFSDFFKRLLNKVRFKIKMMRGNHYQ